MYIDSSKIRINQPGLAARLMARTLTRARRRSLRDWSTASPSITPTTASAFCGSKLAADAISLPLVGHAAMISVGEFVQVKRVLDQRPHARRPIPSLIPQAAAPTTVEGIEKYLGS